MTELHDLKFFTPEILVIQIIILILILWVLNVFIFKPYLSFLDKEMEKRKKLENDYNNIDNLNKEALEKKELILAEARNEAEQIRKTSQDLAKNESNFIKEEAKIEAKNIKSTALSEIGKEKETMMNDVRKKSIDLILKFNAKLFSKESVNKDFIETEIATIR